MGFWGALLSDFSCFFPSLVFTHVKRDVVVAKCSPTQAQCILE